MLAFDVRTAGCGPAIVGSAEQIAADSRYGELSDQARLDLGSTIDGQPPDGFVIVTARTAATSVPNLVGFAVMSPASDADLLEVAADEQPSRLGVDLLETAVSAHHALRPGAALRWWTDDSDGPNVDAALSHGFILERRLLQMEVDLPIDRHASITTRAFEPATDIAAWLSVNNRAFANHGEQSGWSETHLRQRFQTNWFDADGFRILERGGTMMGFCWTKMHGPEIGEIYVIAVDPEMTGRGLGTELVLAGLDSIAARDASAAMLWVDEDNTAAVALYRRLGFEVIRTRSAFVLRRTGDGS